MRILILLFIVGPTAALAMPANPKPFEVRQPDGTPITLRIHGDEYFHWHEDPSGFTVVVDRGTYVYARLDAAGRLAPTQLVVGRSNPAASGMTPHALPSPEVRAELRSAALPQPRGRSGSPLRGSATGTLKNLVVLCKFADHTFGVHTRDAADYDVLWNAVGGDPALAPTGSVRDCYLENSYGLLTIDSTVTAWVTLPYPENYYGNGNNGIGDSYPANAHGMVEDALNAVDPLVDFGEFDTDNDGYIDAISIIHSGYGAETGGGGGDWIWSHRSWLWSLPGGQWTSADLNGAGQNVRVSNYHTEPALWGTSGTNISRIGVAAHETGHFLGLPDLYDTDNHAPGIGYYCMMANSWGFDGTQLHPPHFSAWCKSFLGWVTPTSLPDNTVWVFSAPQVETSPVVYRIDHNFPSGEYLLIENRQPVGLESIMPQGGLAIWHIDEAKCCNTDEGYPGQPGWPANNRHYRVALLQVDGSYELERDIHSGEGDELFHAAGVNSIDDNSVPSTDAYQYGEVIDTHNLILNISAAGAVMSFTYSPFNDCNANQYPDLQETRGGLSPDCNANDTPDECDISTFYGVVSPRLLPVGAGSPRSYTFVAPPAFSDVALRIEAIGDFNSAAERVDVNINGVTVGAAFGPWGHDCPITPDIETISVPKADFNAALSGGNVTVNLETTGDVNPTLCAQGYIRVTMRYMAATQSCNTNGIPDDCDVYGATSNDCNGNVLPDECDTAVYGFLLDVDFENGLPPGWSRYGTMQIGGQCAATSPDCGGAGWAYAGDAGACYYGDRESGELFAPPVTLGYGLNVLSFCSRLESESDFDFARVRVNSTTVWEASGGDATWETQTADLAAFAGQMVILSFEFASDDFVSGTLGWQVDNVRLFAGGADCNRDGLPDECDPENYDCNWNGTHDECDIQSGTSVDCNTNGWPDECEFDVDADSVPDGCDTCPGDPNTDQADLDGDRVGDICDPCPDVFGPWKLLPAELRDEMMDFGFSAAMDGDTAVVGATYSDFAGPPASGSAHVIVRTGNVWTEEAVLTASDAATNDTLGFSVAIDGDTIVVGAPDKVIAGQDQAGAAYVFVRSGGVWTEEGKLTASDGVEYDHFGRSVGVSGDTVVVGAENHTGGLLDGTVYVFGRSAGVWTQEAELTTSNPAAGNYFGAAVAIDSETMLVGAPYPGVGGSGGGSAHVFVRSLGVWTEQAELFASDGQWADLFGDSVALQGDRAVIGAPWAHSDGLKLGHGAAYVFERSDSVWTQRAELAASDGAEQDDFGASVALDGNSIVVGAPRADRSGRTDAGAAYWFARPYTAWREQFEFTPWDAALVKPIVWGPNFGDAVSLEGASMLVGAQTGVALPFLDQYTGAAYAFQLDCVPVPLPGDADGDGDVDLTDYAGFAGCLEQQPPPPECVADFDIDADGDMDLVDFGGLQVLFTGP